MHCDLYLHLLEVSIFIYQEMYIDMLVCRRAMALFPNLNEHKICPLHIFILCSISLFLGKHNLLHVDLLRCYIGAFVVLFFLALTSGQRHLANSVFVYTPFLFCTPFRFRVCAGNQYLTSLANSVLHIGLDIGTLAELV